MNEQVLRKCEVEIRNAAERAMLRFDLRVAGFLKRIRERMGKRKAELCEGMKEVYERLEQEAKCKEYDDELDNVRGVIEGNDQFRIYYLSKKDLKAKSKSKNKQVKSLFQQGKNMLEKSKAFIQDCREIEEVFELYEQGTANKLARIYGKRLTQIKKCELELQEKSQNLKRECDKYNEALRGSQKIINYNKALENNIKKLEEEKEHLIETLEALTPKVEWLTSNFEAKKAEALYQQERLNYLEDLIAKRKEEIRGLESSETTRKEETKKLVTNKMDYKSIEMVYNSNVFFVVDPKLTTLLAYRFDSKSALKYDVAKCEISAGCDCVQICNELYVSGGFNFHKVLYSKNLLKISIHHDKQLNTERKADMPAGKSQHKLVMLNLAFIYCIGGKSLGKNYLNTCERYDVSSNKWETAPSLNEAKRNVGATAVGGCAIYVFGGIHKARSAVVEVLELSLIHICRCRRIERCRSRWSPYP
eukprot:TRINITY_DN12848_c0_g9_i1.p1 TRINITY_DN12848_c0_g9~~TRINITY_DN12848_c0_g9_i1.p1  ORF type:complete len:475 (+),score=105.32 TRINITY_DN12848_c0_g9_i1:274-1698(+)